MRAARGLRRDPEGAAFRGRQPGANTGPGSGLGTRLGTRLDTGLGTSGEDGTLCWAELYTEDAGAATAFYGAVFGWGVTAQKFEGGEYVMVHPGAGTPEDMFAGVVDLTGDRAGAGAAPYWLPYFAVRDCDASVAVARERGGAVLLAPVDIPDVGRAARLADPHGARFALLAPRPPQN